MDLQLDKPPVSKKRKKLDKYEKGRFIGQGTYGVVFQATEKTTNRQVALKKIRMGNVGEDGVPFVGLREIKLLKELHHPNIIEVFLQEFCKNLPNIDLFCIVGRCIFTQRGNHFGI